MDDDVTVYVPAQHVSAVYALLAELTASGPELVPPAAGPPWTAELAWEALQKMLEPEQELVRRLAEARGRRLPLTRLSADLGLPLDASAEQDFPALAEFSAQAGRPAMPVKPGGAEGNAWYWMSPLDARMFRKPAKPQTTSEP